MESHDPSELVRQLGAWVEKSLESLRNDSAHLVEVGKRYRKLIGVIDQLESLNISVPKNIISEKEELGELLFASKKKEKLSSIAEELSSIAREINHRLKREQREGSVKRVRAPAKLLRVRFPDGTIISERIATTTFLRSLQYIGLERIAELRSIRVLGHPLVSSLKHEPSKGTRELDGYFVETTLSTSNKARYIRRIAEELRIDVSVEVID